VTYPDVMDPKRNRRKKTATRQLSGHSRELSEQAGVREVLRQVTTKVTEAAKAKRAEG